MSQKDQRIMKYVPRNMRSAIQSAWIEEPLCDDHECSYWIQLKEGYHLLPQDVNNGLYEEYTVDRVLPEQIRAIYVPEIFKERLMEIAPAVLEQITFCKMTAEIWDNSIDGNEKDCFGNPIPGGYRRVTEDELLRFAQTASLNTWQLNYFRGEHENREVFDLEHIVYQTKGTQI